MPITPRSNSLAISAGRNLRVLVHVADERPDFRDRRTRTRCRGTAVRPRRAWSGPRAVRHAGVVTDCLHRGCYHRPAGTARPGVEGGNPAPEMRRDRVLCILPRMIRLSCRNASVGMRCRSTSSPQPPCCCVAPAAQPGRAGRQRRDRAASRTASSRRSSRRRSRRRGSERASRRRPSAPASTSSASTSSSPTRRATRSPTCSTSDFEVTEDGKPQKIETFKLIKLDGGTADSIKEPPREIRTDYDEEIRSGARRRAAVRDLPRRLPRAARREPGGRAIRSSTFIENTARAARHDRRDVSARVDGVGAHDAQPLGGDARAPAVPGAQVRVQPRNEFEETLRALPGRDRREDPQPGVAVGAQGADRPHGLAEGRAQDADPRQRGLHQHPAAADAQRRRARCPGSATRRTATRWPAPNDPNEDRARGSPASTWTPICARSTTPPTATTSRSTRSIRAACPASSSTSTKASACRPTRST